MLVAVEVTPYHKIVRLVELFLGGSDSGPGGQESDRGQAVPVPQEVVIEDETDVNNCVSVQDKNKLLE
jgi:hypothetical protein